MLRGLSFNEKSTETPTPSVVCCPHVAPHYLHGAITCLNLAGRTGIVRGRADGRIHVYTSVRMRVSATPTDTEAFFMKTDGLSRKGVASLPCNFKL